MPKLSVIVPIYNAENFLERCIDSLLAQTIEDFELILVNDGSTDSSKRICERYKSKDERIILINQQIVITALGVLIIVYGILDIIDRFIFMKKINDYMKD